MAKVERVDLNALHFSALSNQRVEVNVLHHGLVPA